MGERKEERKKKTGRSYTETYTYRELTEKLKGQNPGGETQRGTETYRSCLECRHLKS